MELSHSLHKGMMETTVGSLVNKFKIRKRRNTLFFEDIIAEYIHECDVAGYHDELREMGRQWFFCVLSSLTPQPLLVLPPETLLNLIYRKMWINLGILDELVATKKNNIIEVKTKNEAVTRLMGANSFLFGVYAGALNVSTGKDVKYLSSDQNKKQATYSFELNSIECKLEAKKKRVYDQLNKFEPVKGFTLKDALNSNVITMKKNRLYFRGKSLVPIENTVFHLASNKGILLDKLPSISYDYFHKLVSNEHKIESKLALLKTLLQVMGWGEVIITFKTEREITVRISHPPHGFQPEEDNWSFLLQTILGFLWLINKNLKLSSVETEKQIIKAIYSE